MYKILFTLSLLLGFETVLAQDTLILRTGTEMPVYVVAVEDEAIKFKRLSDKNGQNYIIQKPKVSMIKYQNGKREIFNDISAAGFENKMLSISGSKFYLDGLQINRTAFLDELSQVPEADHCYRNGNAAEVWSVIAAFPGGFIFGWQLVNISRGRKINVPLTAIGGGLLITSVSLGSYSRRLRARAISVYNNKQGKKSAVTIGFGVNSGCIGLAMRF